MADVSAMIESLKPWFADHLARYLRDGKEGHLLDMTAVGGLPNTPTLILKTVGRKSGRDLLAPLIYKDIGGEFAIVGSKGGSDHDPAWFLNLQARPEVEFKVADHCYAGSWRIPAGDEREKVWKEMVEHYPPYRQYQSITERRIPIVLLKPQRPIDKL
jgi:deazaflavin-dependent oxidoreductase (nitroreductase family)